MLYAGGIDVIVSDIMMPGTDGFELVSHVRSVDKKIPIQFYSIHNNLGMPKFIVNYRLYFIVYKDFYFLGIPKNLIVKMNL